MTRYFEPTPALAIIALAMIASACGRDDNPTPRPDQGHSAEDMSPEAKMDMSSPDMLPEAEDMASPDMPSADMKPPLQPCQDDSACAAEEVCLAGACQVAPTCSSVKKPRGCRTAFEEMGVSEELLERAICDGETCRIACVRDTHCDAGEACSDNGLCVPFGSELTGEHPGAGEKTDLRAGIGNTLLQFPIGMPLGGYGSRAGNDGGRYSNALTSSRGQMHGLYSRAVVLDNGARQIAMLRMPIIFPTSALHEAVARRLQEKTGADWRDSLVISGTHTHSGPGRYLHLPPPDETLFPLGSFGTDNFDERAFDWMVDSAVESIEAALDDLSDARFGWEIVEAFDNDDAIASDRWSATPPFDDNRLLLMRIDDADGAPRALMFSFGMHGTFSGSDYATGDAMGGIERALEKKFGAEYDRFVPTMFFNQNGGTMAPRGDRQGHHENHKFEHIGERFVERMWENIEDVQTDRDVELQGVTLRFPLGYQELGYAADEWVDARDREQELSYGGLQCAVANAEDDDFTTSLSPDENVCLGIRGILYNRPPTLFLRSQMTALSFDGLTMITLPGEASMELGWQVLRDIQGAHGIDPLDSWVFGYAQDHQFYLTPTNLRGPLPPFPGISTPMAPDDYPDFAFSYYQGGYEAGFTIWGARMGDYLVQRAIEATGLLLGKPVELANPSPLPTQYSSLGTPAFPIDATPEERIGEVTTQPPSSIARLDQLEFAWIGGDPGAEMPQAPRVVLEREDGGIFAPVIHVNTREYDNREPLMITRLRQRPDDDLWEWVVYWEELEDFPTGTYRFKLEGHYQSASGERLPYTSQTDTFELTTSDAIEVDAEASATALRGTFGYPAAARLEVTPEPNDRAKVVGTYRLRHADVPTGVRDPVFVPSELSDQDVTIEIKRGGQVITTLTGAQITLSTAPESVAGRSNVPVTRFEATFDELESGEPHTFEITLTDVHGNTGTKLIDFTP